MAGLLTYTLRFGLPNSLRESDLKIESRLAVLTAAGTVLDFHQIPF